MNLDLFNDLFNKAKENNIIQNFIQELGNYLEKNTLENKPENETSLLEKMQEQNPITAEYRDKMSLERRTILETYASQTKDQGTMYYIYDKSGNDYLVSICEEARSHEIIKIPENELPKGAGIDSVLREQDGNYVWDKEATKIITEKMTQKFQELLEEQNQKMQERRVEGHLYEFVEKAGNSIFLIDKNENTGKVFQELEFEPQIFENAKEGDTFQYLDGQYKKT